MDIQINLKITYYLDVTLNFRKCSQRPFCIEIGCNHPKDFFKHIANGVMFRLSTDSFNFNIFNQSKSNYEIVVKTIEAIKTKLSVETRIKLLMQIIGGEIGLEKSHDFAPPYNLAVANKQWKVFFTILK